MLWLCDGAELSVSLDFFSKKRFGRNEMVIAGRRYAAAVSVGRPFGILHSWQNCIHWFHSS